MADQEGIESDFPERLRLVKSPLITNREKSTEASLHSQTFNEEDARALEGQNESKLHDETPEFLAHDEATNIELFYDLFFAANLTVFSEVHEVTDSTKLISYISYFCMLWLTWALVGLFDVRFLTDSIFERFARAAHLGVMVGFAVVAPNFNPNEQVQQTFQAMSIILMVSRITLSIQYAVIYWHVRKYRDTLLPLGIMAGTHFIAAMIYLGMTFGFRNGASNVYAGWYVVAIIEVAIAIGASPVWKVLSFGGTHLTQRLTLLTFIIIGEGIIVICKNITSIVVNADSWSAATIGNITAGIATLYLTYMIYFDWMHRLHLPTWRQLAWAALHLPFHLSLTLFVEGTSQFVLWWKILEVLNQFKNQLGAALSPDGSSNFTAATFIKATNETVEHLFTLYPPIYVFTWTDFQEALEQFSTLSDGFWNDNATDADNSIVLKAAPLLFDTIQNSLLASFGIDGFVEAGKNFNGTTEELEIEVADEGDSRFHIVFMYAYISAGVTLILLNLLFITSRTKRWTAFGYFRVAFNFLVGIGICLLTLVNLNDDTAVSFENSPWMLPTLCLILFFVLIVNHLPSPRKLLQKRKSRKQNKMEQGQREIDLGRDFEPVPGSRT